jgi:hypothetical protein
MGDTSLKLDAENLRESKLQLWHSKTTRQKVKNLRRDPEMPCFTGAQKLMFDYNSQGQVVALAFAMEVEGRIIGFKLPARIEQVETVLKNEKRWSSTQDLKDQVYRTCWANMRDWVTAKMALVDTRMAKLQGVFLPYMPVRMERPSMSRWRKTAFSFPVRQSHSDPDAVRRKRRAAPITLTRN